MRDDIKQILQMVTGNDNITEADIKSIQDMNERKKYLEKHYKTHKKWETDGVYYTYLPDETKKRKIKLCKRNSEKALEDAIVAHYKADEHNPSIDDVFKEWNDKKLANKSISKSTHDRNQYCYDRYYSTFGKRRIGQVFPYEFQDFLEEQIMKFSLSAKSFSNLKTITRGFLKRAKKLGYISFSVDEMLNDMDTTDRSFKKKHKDDSEEVFYDDEVERIIEYIKENPTSNNLAVGLMFCTGLRIGEVATLKHSDFDGMTVTISRSETKYRTEGNKYIYEVQDHPKSAAGFRTVVIPDSYKWLVDKLKTCNPFGEWVFTKRDGKTRCTTNTIATRERGICKAVGIPFRSSHKIRKTYGSILLDNNVDAKFIQSQMGHADIEVTENYYHKDRRRINQKSAIINSISDFAI